MGASTARQLGLVDDCYDTTPPTFLSRALEDAARLAVEDFTDRLAEKCERRAADEARKPLAAYRAEEMEKMRLNFFGFDSSYHVARYNFVRKMPKSRTPSYLARHRALQTAIC